MVALRLLLNPLDRGGRTRFGVPIFAGSFPVIGHLMAARYALPELLGRAERALGSMVFLEFPGPRGVTVDLVPLESSAAALMRTTALDSSVLRVGAHELLGESMIVRDGSDHHRQRSALSGPFTPRGLGGAAVGSAFSQIVIARTRAWIRGGGIRILEQTEALTLELIFRLLDAPPDDLDAWRRKYKQFLAVVARFPIDVPGSPFDRGSRARTWLDDRVRGLIRRALEASPDASFLARVVQGEDGQGTRLSDRELSDNIRLLLLAGYETTATAMAWLLIELGRRPDLFERLVEEASRAGRVPDSPRALRDFPFAESLFREVVRLHPPVPLLGRSLVEDLEMGRHRIPAGTRVAMPIVHFARDPSHYAEPERFDPDRWAGRDASPSSLETISFGSGAHFCLGYHLAWLEIVELAVALGLACKEAGVAPRYDGAEPRTVWFPLGAPDGRARLRFVRR